MFWMPALNFGFLYADVVAFSLFFDCFSIFCIVKLFVTRVSRQGPCLICRDVTCRRATASAGSARVMIPTQCPHSVTSCLMEATRDGKYFACASSKSISYAGRQMENEFDIAHTLFSCSFFTPSIFLLRTTSSDWVWSRVDVAPLSFLLLIYQKRWQHTKLSLF